MKKFNKAVLVPVLAALALGGVGVAGTYALFTSKVDESVEIATGTVKITAAANELQTKQYGDDAYSDKTNSVGTATLEGTKLTLTNFIAGDYAKFTVAPKNESNVNIKWRVKVTVGDGIDSSALAVNLLDADGKAITLTDNYSPITATTTAGEALPAYQLEVGIKNDAGKMESLNDKKATISVSYEAMQANAKDEDFTDANFTK